MAEQTEPPFPPALMEAILKSSIKTGSMKIGPVANRMAAELVALFVQEALERASLEARTERDGEREVTVTPDHVGRVMAQLLLDF